MSRLDRLSALIARFEVRVEIAEPGQGNLLILGDAGSFAPHQVVLRPDGSPACVGTPGTVLFEANAQLGGPVNPLVTALSEQISHEITDDGDDTGMLLRVLLSEAGNARCGMHAVLNRLAEVLIVYLLRREIARGSARPGLVAGLSCPQISKAVVAIHESPGRNWKNDELASLSGLSLSRFAEVFQLHLNESPQSYLRRWRMTLALQDIHRGDRIKTVSRRYGYASSEAFAKAFQRQFGTKPTAVRSGAAAARGSGPLVSPARSGNYSGAP